MKKIIAVIVVLLLILAGVTLLKKRQNSVIQTPTATRPALRVQVVSPKAREIRVSNRFLAQLQSVDQANISSKLSGRIESIAVQEGAHVKQGERLIRIDDREISTVIAGLNAQLSAAQKQHDYSTSLYKRNLALYEAGGLAREKLESSEVSQATAMATVTDLKQKIKAAKSQLEYLQIKAPFAGIVGTVFQSHGDLASPGKTILSLNSLAQQLTFSYAPDSINIAPGQTVLLDGQPLATISRLHNDARNGLTVAEATLETRLNRPAGSQITIAVISQTLAGCSVPTQALLHRAEGQSIMVYQDNQFTAQPVQVVGHDDQFAVIAPCTTLPVAIASESKLSLLPNRGKIRIFSGQSNE